MANNEMVLIDDTIFFAISRSVDDINNGVDLKGELFSYNVETADLKTIRDINDFLYIGELTRAEEGLKYTISLVGMSCMVIEPGDCDRSGLDESQMGTWIYNIETGEHTKISE